MIEQGPEQEPIKRLSRDLRDAAATLSADEARFLVDAYYSIQENRKASANQLRSLQANNEPHSVIAWLKDQDQSLEAQIKRALDRWTDEQPLGRWCKHIVGIGPVITAGLLAHIDMTKANTAGKIWSFAGLDPTKVWAPKTKRPWNAALKTLCWKLGESFVKVSNLEGDFYGKIYQERKAIETAKNEAGEYADQAKAKLEKFNIGKTTEAYKYYSSGKLPPAHIHARAKRYAVKLFLAHYQHMGSLLVLHQEPVKPYVIEHLGHIDMILPPGVDKSWEK